MNSDKINKKEMKANAVLFVKFIYGVSSINKEGGRCSVKVVGELE